VGGGRAELGKGKKNKKKRKLKNNRSKVNIMKDRQKEN